MMFLQIFINFIQGHLRLKKELNFNRLQNWRKIVRPRVKFFEPVPKLAHPPTRTSSTSTFPNWHFPHLAPPATATFRKSFLCF